MNRSVPLVKAPAKIKSNAEETAVVAVTCDEVKTKSACRRGKEQGALVLEGQRGPAPSYDSRLRRTMAGGTK